jgi:hypothetical protein
MAIADQGIMSLPTQEAPQIGLEDSYDAMLQGLQTARPDAAADLQSELAAIRPMVAELTDDQLDDLIEAFMELYENPDGYEEAVAELVRSGDIDEGDIPSSYDPEFLAAMIAVLLDEKRSRGMAGQTMAPEMVMPQGFARGGIAEAARLVASQGRNGDTRLAHITPREERILKARGGSGTINPVTGLPEYFLGRVFRAIGRAVKNTVKRVGNAVKSVLKSPVGRILGTIALAAVLGPAGLGIASATFAPVLASAGVTALSGGSLKDVLIAGATSYLGGAASPIGGYVSKVTGVTNPLAVQGISSGVVGTAASLAAGKNLEDAVKTGLTGAVINVGTNMAQNAFAKPTTPAPVEDRSRMATEGIAPGGQAIPPYPPSVSPTAAPAPGGIATLRPQPSPAPVSPTATAAPAPSAAPQSALASPPPSIPDSLLTMGQGVGQMFRGNIAEGAGTLASGAKNLFMPSGPSPEQIQGIEQQFGVGTAATRAAIKDVTPGFFRTYGPATAAGIGALAMSGGFDQKPPAQSEFAEQMRQPIDLSGDPRRYYIQNLPGVQYDARGQIIGSAPTFTPPQTLEDVRVAGRSFIGFNPMMYSQPTDQMNQPRFMNMGGIASLAQGGYPRRVGQISGPGTEKSDSIPAMLSDGEFVMTARAVRGMGNGSRREGAKKMYSLMHKLERNAARG